MFWIKEDVLDRNGSKTMNRMFIILEKIAI